MNAERPKLSLSGMSSKRLEKMRTVPTTPLEEKVTPEIRQATRELEGDPFNIEGWDFNKKPYIEYLHELADFINSNNQRQRGTDESVRLLEVHDLHLVYKGTDKQPIGHALEKELFDTCTFEARDSMYIPNGKKTKNAESFNALKKYVREYQPEDQTWFQEQINSALTERINAFCDYDPELSDLSVTDVRGFTAAGSSIDFSFGVDGWFEINFSNGDTETVHFDLKSSDQDKSLNEYADTYLIVKHENGKPDFNESQEYLDEFVSKAARSAILKQKIAVKQSMRQQDSLDQAA